jgi:hypothetical protein
MSSLLVTEKDEAAAELQASIQEVPDFNPGQVVFGDFSQCL